MAAVANGAVGGEDRPLYSAVVREDSDGPAAPGDGVSRLSGDHSAGGEVLARADGSSSGACAAVGRLPLPQRGIDFEELAGPAAAAGGSGCATGSTSAA